MAGRRPPTESGPAKGYPPAGFAAKPRSGLFVDKHAVMAAIGDPDTVIVNALGPQFHRGLEPSRYGRPGTGTRQRQRAGGNSRRSGKPRPQALAEAAAKFEAHGVTQRKALIAYCGGGISATIDLFLLHQLGYDNLRSTTARWANGPRILSLPIETD